MVSTVKSSFQSKRDRARDLALELIAEIDSCTERDEAALIEGMKMMTSAKNLMSSMKEHKVLESLQLKVNANEPWNKSIDCQRNFFSTKSSKVEAPRAKLAKPTWEEKENFLSSTVWSDKTSCSKSKILIPISLISKQMTEKLRN